jgi:hypothetical protein
MANAAAHATPAPGGSAPWKRKAQIALVSISVLSGVLSALVSRHRSPPPDEPVAAGAEGLADDLADDPADRSPATRLRAEQAAAQSYSHRTPSPEPLVTPPRLTPPPLKLDLPPPPPLPPAPPPAVEPSPSGDEPRRPRRRTHARLEQQTSAVDTAPMADSQEV